MLRFRSCVPVKLFFHRPDGCFWRPTVRTTTESELYSPWNPVESVGAAKEGGGFEVGQVFGGGWGVPRRLRTSSAYGPSNYYVRLGSSGNESIFHVRVVFDKYNNNSAVGRRRQSTGLHRPRAAFVRPAISPRVSRGGGRRDLLSDHNGWKGRGERYDVRHHPGRRVARSPRGAFSGQWTTRKKWRKRSRAAAAPFPPNKHFRTAEFVCARPKLPSRGSLGRTSTRSAVRLPVWRVVSILLKFKICKNTQFTLSVNYIFTAKLSTTGWPNIIIFLV